MSLRCEFHKALEFLVWQGQAETLEELLEEARRYLAQAVVEIPHEEPPAPPRTWRIIE